MSKGMGGHHRPGQGSFTRWKTPPEVLSALGPFQDDPADNANDGLLREWVGLVFLNPPYTRRIGEWLDRAVQHGQALVLLFARTETAHFHRYVWPHATSLLFLRGRLHFYHEDGRRAAHNAGAPSVLIAYGEVADQRLRRSKLNGFYLRLSKEWAT